jgi:calcineurin-like phosphoesterase family protein
MIHFVSDTHFYHKNIIKYSNRLFSSVEEMNQKMIDNWNAVVQPTDTVWHLGDFAFCNYLLFAKLLTELNGNINVVLGNHDKTIEENSSKLLAAGLLKSIQNYKELKVDGKTIVLLHYPMRSWNKKHHGSYHLFGHVHASMDASPWGRSADMGVDSKLITSEYRPVSLTEVYKLMESRQDIIVDHHNERNI